MILDYYIDIDYDTDYIQIPSYTCFTNQVTKQPKSRKYTKPRQQKKLTKKCKKFVR
jgi:hypothetical protein